MLGLLDPHLDAVRLAAVLGRFHAFWGATEPLVDHWAVRAPALAAELDWPRRRRTPLLAADVLALGATPAAADRLTLLPLATDADVLGWLYVSEGSTLGGAVLARHLAPRGLRVASFTPYDEGPGPMWKRFGAVVGRWAGDDDDRVAEVSTAARTAFDALAAWLEPLRRSSPAATVAAPVAATLAAAVAG